MEIMHTDTISTAAAKPGSSGAPVFSTSDGVLLGVVRSSVNVGLNVDGTVTDYRQLITNVIRISESGAFIYIIGASAIAATLELLWLSSRQ